MRRRLACRRLRSSGEPFGEYHGRWHGLDGVGPDRVASRRRGLGAYWVERFARERRDDGGSKRSGDRLARELRKLERHRGRIGR